jgi:hypothetical protein
VLHLLSLTTQSLPPGGKSAGGKQAAAAAAGSVAGSEGGGAAGAGGKPVSMAEVVKQARAGKSTEAEDGLVMETKLKIIEILQVGDNRGLLMKASTQVVVLSALKVFDRRF